MFHHCMGAFQIKHLYICVIPSLHLTLQMYTILVPHMIINDCGFKFSMACKWHVLIEEDKDNSLQFDKVLFTKFLELPIHKSFSPSLFCTIW